MNIATYSSSPTTTVYYPPSTLPDPNYGLAIFQFLLGLAGALVFIIPFFILPVILFWFIVSKAGYKGVLSLLYFVPVVNIIFLALFAFKEWPIQKELKALKAQQPITPSPQPYSPPTSTPAQ